MNLLTYKDISDRTGIPVNRLYVWRNRGKMPEPTVDNHQPLWAEKEIEEWMLSKGPSTD